MNPHDVGRRLQMIVPGQQAITLYIRQPTPPDDVFKAYSIYGARGRPSKQTNASGGGNVLAATRKTWHLYRPSLNAGGVPPNTVSESFDYLVDSFGVQWNIESVDVKSNNSFILLETYQTV